MFGFLSKMFDSNQKALDSYQPIVDEVNSLETKFKDMPLEKLRARLDEMRLELQPLVEAIPDSEKSSLRAVDRKGGLNDKEKAIQDKLQELLPEVFAIVREVARKDFNRRHFDVQVLAGAILASGQKLTELKTGEGKTQVFHLPLALYGLTKRGAHAVTVNDYLARRDAEYAGHVLSRLGFSVGVITPQHSYKFVETSELKNVKPEEEYKEAVELKVVNPGDVKGLNLLSCTKKEAYDCDIVYGTNNEFGFDYLRDNMAFSLERIVQRELYFCIVDEADSILIDEARTPLIISAPAAESNQLYERFAGVVKMLNVEEDYTVDEKAHSAVLTDKGTEKVENILGVDNLWQDYQLAHHLENALKAHSLYEKDKEYLVKDGEVLIVDQFTGRVLPGRRYSEGLHQAIEAKEGVEIKRESKTLATITFQNFFRLYKVLDGASGTIMTEAEEFYKIYNLESIAVPTNRPVVREDLTDRVYKNRESKFEAVKEEIKAVHKKGQPILVGTTSIDDSEYLSKLLDREGVPHEVLNAKYHEKEARIVANAGKKGAVTVATNMAGRGTDIKLGGQNATKKDYEKILELGGLYVIGTERHEARRVDNQLRGRSGRQGESGVSRFYVALDDEIMRIQGGNVVQRLMEMTNIPDDMPIESGMIGNSISNAQKKMEGHHFDIRKRLVEYDDVMNQQREIFYTRRRSYLELAENSKGKFWKGRDVVLLEEDERRETSLGEMRETLSSFIDDEIRNIVSSHFFSDRDDDVDIKKVVEQILDLAQDDHIVRAVKESEDEKLNKDMLPKYLSDKLEDKDPVEITEYFLKLFEEVKKAKFDDYGKDLSDVSKAVVLEGMDQLWTDHIESMGDLREGISLRGYAQRDPLVEYKNEAFRVFEKLISDISSQVARRILKMVRVERSPEQNVVIKTNEDQISDILTGSREMLDNVKDTINNIAKKQQKQEKKEIKKIVALEDNKFKGVGRNDPCPCGSGKKFKKCHGK